MRLSLPNSLYIRNRLVEVLEERDGKESVVFRLSDKYRQRVLEHSPGGAIPALPSEDMTPLQAMPALVAHLRALSERVLAVPGFPERIAALAALVSRMAHTQPDGVIAAIMLCPYHHYTAHHAINCSLLAARLGQSLALTSQAAEQLVCAALTMNIASAKLQDRMASQQAGPSTAQQQTLHAHPLLAAAMLREAGVEDEAWLELVLLHHEKTDGRGYPFGLSGDDIEHQVHRLHALDLVTAKMMPRTYRSRLKPKVALGELYAGKMEQVEPELVSHLVKIIGIYPPGSFVELADGDRAIVVRQTDNVATPIVASQTRPGSLIDTGQAEVSIVKALNFQVEERYLPLFYRLWEAT